MHKPVPLNVLPNLLHFMFNDENIKFVGDELKEVPLECSEENAKFNLPTYLVIEKDKTHVRVEVGHIKEKMN